MLIRLVPACYADPDLALNTGETIFRQGVLASGKPVEATREPGMRMEGRDAACVNCHRRSGFGSREGLLYIPPITGRYLFYPRVPGPGDVDVPYVEGMRVNRDPYTDATLARAIREGLGSDGKPLSYLMPHFALDDTDMSALIGYLKHLDQRRLPGVTDTVLQFATIITPDADPVMRKGMLDVITQFFADKNTFPLNPTPHLRSHKWKYMVNRRWQLHIWQLTGPPTTWQDQLERHFAQEPVLAVVSGLAGKTWAPVQAFCEREAVPCLFPNVGAPPPDADHDYYSLYFSKGVELEAELIADRLLKPDKGDIPKLVQQIFRAGDVGESGAKALAASLEAQGIAVRSAVLPAGGAGHGLAKAVRQAAKADALVMWLRPADISALGKAPTKPVSLFMSGLMGGLERAPLPSGWRERTSLAYPFALPDQRIINVDYAFGWFRIRHIPVVAEQVQADTFLACGLLAETLKHMADNFVPEYMIERIEDMLDQRLVTGYYPHLSLAPGQRFASKGGYIARFAEPQGAQLIADGRWVVP